MAVAGNFEWKVEAAFVTVLGESTDLTGVTIRRYNDITTPVTYPSIVVRAGSTRNESWAPVSDFSNALVDLVILTRVYDAITGDGTGDTTGSKIADYLGAVRDKLYEASIVADLTGAVTGLTVYGVVLEDEANIDDDNSTRVRVLTVRVHGSAQDVA